MRVNRKGFEILFSRDVSLPEIDLSSLERSYRIKVPEKYKIFINSFILDKLNLEQYYNPNANDTWFCGSIWIGSMSDHTFDYFMPIEESYRQSDMCDEFLENRFLPIGYGSNYHFVLGTKKENADKIYSYHGDRIPNFSFISNDIFEFVKSFIEVPCEEEDIWGGFKYSQFYKHWGDQEWQVKD